MTDPAFWDRGYAVAHDLVDAAQREFVRAAMDVSRRTGRMHFATRVAPQGAFNEYSPIAGEVLLLRCRATIEAITGRELVPAYAFWRIYEHGAVLLRHCDRSSCEVSASLPIFSAPADRAWPIHLCGLDGAEAAIELRPGAGIIYQGCRIPHWREAFDGQLQYQLFLHYVIKDGDNAVHAFDGRESLNLRLRDRPDG